MKLNRNIESASMGRTRAAVQSKIESGGQNHDGVGRGQGLTSRRERTKTSEFRAPLFRSRNSPTGLVGSRWREEDLAVHHLWV